MIQYRRPCQVRPQTVICPNADMVHKTRLAFRDVGNSNTENNFLILPTQNSLFCHQQGSCMYQRLFAYNLTSYISNATALHSASNASLSAVAYELGQ